MKKFLLILSLLLCVQQMPAQEVTPVDDNPYTFKGIPIEGNVNQFIAKLEKQGYTVMDMDSPNTAFANKILLGKFFAQDVAILLAIDSNKNVTSVSVNFHTDKNYTPTDDRINTYNSVRNGLITKYSDTGMWIIDDSRDTKDKSLNDITYELVVKGIQYNLNIYKKGVEYPYIMLSLSKDASILMYTNPKSFESLANSIFNDL